MKNEEICMDCPMGGSIHAYADCPEARCCYCNGEKVGHRAINCPVESRRLFMEEVAQKNAEAARRAEEVRAAAAQRVPTRERQPATHYKPYQIVMKKPVDFPMANHNFDRAQKSQVMKAIEGKSPPVYEIYNHETHRMETAAEMHLLNSQEFLKKWKTNNVLPRVRRFMPRDLVRARLMDGIFVVIKWAGPLMPYLYGDAWEVQLVKPKYRWEDGIEKVWGHKLEEFLGARRIAADHDLILISAKNISIFRDLAFWTENYRTYQEGELPEDYMGEFFGELKNNSLHAQFFDEAVVERGQKCTHVFLDPNFDIDLLTPEELEANIDPLQRNVKERLGRKPERTQPEMVQSDQMECEATSQQRAPVRDRLGHIPVHNRLGERALHVTERLGAIGYTAAPKPRIAQEFAISQGWVEDFEEETFQQARDRGEQVHYCNHMKRNFVIGRGGLRVFDTNLMFNNKPPIKLPTGAVIYDSYKEKLETPADHTGVYNSWARGQKQLEEVEEEGRRREKKREEEQLADERAREERTRDAQRRRDSLAMAVQVGNLEPPPRPRNPKPEQQSSSRQHEERPSRARTQQPERSHGYELDIYAETDKDFQEFNRSGDFPTRSREFRRQPQLVDTFSVEIRGKSKDSRSGETSQERKKVRGPPRVQLLPKPKVGPESVSVGRKARFERRRQQKVPTDPAIYKLWVEQGKRFEVAPEYMEGDEVIETPEPTPSQTQPIKVPEFVKPALPTFKPKLKKVEEIGASTGQASQSKVTPTPVIGNLNKVIQVTPTPPTVTVPTPEKGQSEIVLLEEEEEQLEEEIPSPELEDAETEQEYDPTNSRILPSLTALQQMEGAEELDYTDEPMETEEEQNIEALYTAELPHTEKK
jgi:hypothetical protein